MPTATLLRLLSLFLAAPLLVCAQDPNASQTELIQTLLARIDKLEKRVSELETKSTPAVESKAAVTEPLVVRDAAHEHDTATGTFSNPNLRVAGFTDVNFGATDQRGVRSGFSEGQFTLHLSSSLGPRVSYFGELNASA